MGIKAEQFGAELADREAIRDCLYRYSRGVDRCDEEMLRSVYWADAYDDHCLFTGHREDLIAWVLPLLRTMESSQHSISNILIRLNIEHADVESYYHGYHRLNDGAKAFDSIQAGRYVDRFEKRQGEWRIVNRKMVVDWFHEYTDAGDWLAGTLGNSQIKPGGRDPDDDSYRLLSLRP